MSDELMELPEGWEWTPFEEIVINHDGRRIPVNSSDRKNKQGKFPYYGASGIIDYVDSFLFEGRHLLIAEDGANLLSRSTPIAFEADGRFWVNNHAHVVEAIEDLVSSSYLRDYINFKDLSFYISGSAQPKLNQKNLNRIPIPLPPLNEQKRIVAQIEALRERSQKVKTALEAIPELCDRFRQSVLAAAFRGDLTADWREQNPDVEPASVLLERIRSDRQGKKQKYKKLDITETASLPQIPSSWVWAALPELGELSRGKSKHRPRNDPALFCGNYPFIQTGEIAATDGVIYHFSQTYSEFGLKQSRLWKKGTLCITIAANIAETAILGIDACFPDSVVGFLPEEHHCDVRFVEFFIRTAKGDLERYAPATAQKNINLEVLNSVAVPFPPLEEQKEIANQIEYYFSQVKLLENFYTHCTQALDRLNQSILAKAFRGELVEQDPNDEPASVLLDRIRAEREAQQPAKKSQRKGNTGRKKQGT